MFVNNCKRNSLISNAVDILYSRQDCAVNVSVSLTTALRNSNIQVWAQHAALSTVMTSF
jgi:hypothetical protein